MASTTTERMPVLYLSHGAPPLVDHERWPAELPARGGRGFGPTAGGGCGGQVGGPALRGGVPRGIGGVPRARPGA